MAEVLKEVGVGQSRPRGLPQSCAKTTRVTIMARPALSALQSVATVAQGASFGGTLSKDACRLPARGIPPTAHVVSAKMQRQGVCV